MSKTEIRAWFQQGVSQGANYMVVMCDTFDYTYYPVYYFTTDDVRSCAPGSMTRLMEIYDLSMDREQQLDEERAMHLPPQPQPQLQPQPQELRRSARLAAKHST